jgi:hypothetical protein
MSNRKGLFRIFRKLLRSPLWNLVLFIILFIICKLLHDYKWYTLRTVHPETEYDYGEEFAGAYSRYTIQTFLEEKGPSKNQESKSLYIHYDYLQSR